MVAIIVPVVGIGCAAVAVDIGNWYVRDAAGAEGGRRRRARRSAVPPAGPAQRHAPAPSRSRRATASTTTRRTATHEGNTVTVASATRRTQLKVTISVTIKNTVRRRDRRQRADHHPDGTWPTTRARHRWAARATPSATSPTRAARRLGDPSRLGAGREPAVRTARARRSSGRPSRARRPARSRATATRPRSARTAASTAAPAGTNDEYDDFGYVFVVKVQTGGGGQPIDLQLYDPMFVYTGQDCERLPRPRTPSATTGNTNPYVTNSDARNRYSKRRCRRRAASAPGDSFPGDGLGREPESRHDHVVRPAAADRHAEPEGRRRSRTTPAAAPASSSTAASTPATTTSRPTRSRAPAAATTTRSRRPSTTGARSARFTPTRSGDYYLQVRTNVCLGGSTVSGRTGLIKSGNTAAAAADGQHHQR